MMLVNNTNICNISYISNLIAFKFGQIVNLVMFVTPKCKELSQAKPNQTKPNKTKNLIYSNISGISFPFGIVASSLSIIFAEVSSYAFQAQQRIRW